MPNVSIVLPTYHHCRTVGRALQSVLNQSYRDFEVIVLDDGSTDGTHEILSGFQQADSRVRVYRNEINSGSPARICNEGIKQYAESEFIAFQFDDDFWLDWCLESLVNGSDGYDFVYGQTAFIDSRTKEFMYVLGNVKIDKSNILTGGRLANNAVLIRRSLFLSLGGFDENPYIRRVCDWDLWVRVVYEECKINAISQLVSVCMPYQEGSIGMTHEWDRVGTLKYMKNKVGIE